MDKELLTKFQSVVDSFNRKEFTSHDFIKKFLERYMRMIIVIYFR